LHDSRGESPILLHVPPSASHEDLSLMSPGLIKVVVVFLVKDVVVVLSCEATVVVDFLVETVVVEYWVQSSPGGRQQMHPETKTKKANSKSRRMR